MLVCHFIYSFNDEHLKIWTEHIRTRTFQI